MLAHLVETDTRFSSLQYFIFGLGNRNYRYYNCVAHVVDVLLQKLEAKCLGPIGEVDKSNGGTDKDFLA